jgi:hypothetical protein
LEGVSRKFTQLENQFRQEREGSEKWKVNDSSDIKCCFNGKAYDRFHGTRNLWFDYS